MIDELQQQTGANGAQVSEVLGLGYRRLLRWRKRTSAGKPALVPPGPKKAAALPIAELKAEIATLSHGRHRTAGTSQLYVRHRDGISRRDLTRLVAEERGRQNQTRRQVCKHVTWHVPNLAWAIDTTERSRDSRGHRLCVQATQDLCSRYRFESLVALESKGAAVAAYLDELFTKYGAPLFLKRDNGSALNDAEVDAALARHGVIPLNSPAHYPQYNGAIEKSIREIKEVLAECLPQPALWQPKAVAPYVNAVRYELNCRPRRSLHGHSACEAYHHQPHIRYNMRDRLAVFEWMRVHAHDRIKQLEKIDRRSVLAAWRAAAETWLRCQGLITVSINQKVLPHLPKKYVQD